MAVNSSQSLPSPDLMVDFDSSLSAGEWESAVPHLTVMEDICANVHTDPGDELSQQQPVEHLSRLTLSHGGDVLTRCRRTLRRMTQRLLKTPGLNKQEGLAATQFLSQ